MATSERTYESLFIEESHVYDTKHFFIPPHYGELLVAYHPNCQYFSRLLWRHALTHILLISEGTLDKVLLPYGMIQDRVVRRARNFMLPRTRPLIELIAPCRGHGVQEKLARDILEDYAKEEQTIHLLCVLKGSANFFQVLSGR
jgi:hypothetical protein